MLAQKCYDILCIFHAKHLSTGRARRCTYLDNSYDGCLSLSFAFDAFIYGLLLYLCWNLILLTFCFVYPLCYLSRQNSGKFALILNVLIFEQYLGKCSILVSVLELIWPTCEFGRPGFLNKTCKHFKSNLIQLGKIWPMEYLETFCKRI